jgi:hypothetical protein
LVADFNARVLVVKLRKPALIEGSGEGRTCATKLSAQFGIAIGGGDFFFSSCWLLSIRGSLLRSATSRNPEGSGE